MAENDIAFLERLKGLGYGPSGRSRFSMGNILTLLAMAGSLAGVWGQLSAQNSRMDQRVTTIERDQVNDKKDAKEDRKEIKQDIKQINSNVQLILNKIEARDAVDADRRRRGDGVR